MCVARDHGISQLTSQWCSRSRIPNVPELFTWKQLSALPFLTNTSAYSFITQWSESVHTFQWLGERPSSWDSVSLSLNENKRRRIIHVIHLCYVICRAKSSVFGIYCMLVVCKRVLVCGHFHVFPPVFNISLPHFSLFAETSQCLCRWVCLCRMCLFWNPENISSHLPLLVCLLVYNFYTVSVELFPLFSFGWRWYHWVVGMFSEFCFGFHGRDGLQCVSYGLFICTGLYQLYIYIHYKY